MTETAMQCSLRLLRENRYYGGFGGGVCPLCGMSALARNTTGAYCYNCQKQIDMDEVGKDDRS